MIDNENNTSLIDITAYPIAGLLDILLIDRTTKKNIIWATDAYSSYGEGFQDKNQMFSNAFISGKALTIRPRIEKAIEEQQERTKKKAEVFTPAWLCNQMNNYLDEGYFGRKDIFNVENTDHTWDFKKGKISIDNWQDYIKLRYLEITCGEAPFLVSRYDTSTGTLILPPFNRIGLLDRKLRVISENTEKEEDWLKWTTKAYQNIYGYEYQGDNLLIARINLLLTFIDYYKDKFNKEPDFKLLKSIANIISWNIWQMDGLKDTVPLGKPFVEHEQLGLDLFGDIKEDTPASPCIIKDWRTNKTIIFATLKENNMSKKLFDYVIGNPPYQESRDTTKDMPVYNMFMEEAYKVSDKTELITPARFLFNAGATPKTWNEKMLNDEHFKILKYEPNSSVVFANTDIKGGVAIHYRDLDKKYGSTGIFTIYSDLNNILKKVQKNKQFESLEKIMYSPANCRFTDLFIQTQKSETSKLSDGNEKMLATNIFETLDETTFFKENPNDGHLYCKVLGRYKNERVFRWINSDYIEGKNIKTWKVCLPKVSGIGKIGEVLSSPTILENNTGHTQSFFSIGSCDQESAKNILKYIKSKFSRAMLSVLKVTQDCPPTKWKYVPLQDFTSNSDIDWSKSIHEIDLQLYKKYGLDDKEIEFIESHVKEMK